MEANERPRYLEIVGQTPDRLTATLKGIPKKLLLWTPSPGKWSILEIVCHMRDMEEDAYLARYRRILGEEGPLLKNIDGDAYALEREYRKLKLGKVLGEWKKLRRETLKLLKNVKDDQWQRAGVHETDGPLTLDTVLRRQAVGNDEAHLGQIEHIKLRHELFQKYENGVRLVESAVKGTPEDILRRRPEPNKWSILENLSHLRVTEQIFQTRCMLIANSEKPSLSMYDNNELAAKLKYNEQNPAESLKEFKRLRADTLTLLRALSQKSWQRVGIHPKRGEMTLESLVKLLADHDSNHATQIRVIREKFGAMRSATA